MKEAIRRQIRAQWKDWLVVTAVLSGVVIFGNILLFIIIHASGEEIFPMGILLGAGVLVIFGMLSSLGGTVSYFNMEVSMGSTRGQFFLSHLLTDIGGMLLNLLWLMLLSALERALCGVLYPRAGSEELFATAQGYLLRYGFAAVLLLSAVGCFCGALTLRFGRRATVVLWVLYMAGAIGVPNVFSAAEDAPDSFFGRLGSKLLSVAERVPGGLWVLLGAALALVSLAGAWLLLRRQAVTA